MKGLQEKLRRLTEMDAEEIRFRVVQKLRLQREQVQMVFDGKNARNPQWWRDWDASKVSEPGLRASIEAGDQVRAARLVSAYFANRARPRFFFDMSERTRIAAEIGKRLASRAAEIQKEAEAICGHRFKIFAHPEVVCGPRIPWRRDLVHGVESGLDHHSRVPTLDAAKVGDSKNVWEINRHQHFFALGEAFLLTGDERFAEECLSQWEDWIEQNPYRRGINWASSLEVAFRSWSWIWMFNLLLGAKALTGDRIGRLTLAIGRNAEFITDNLSIYFAPNTHLLGEGFALFVTGLLFPELKDSEEFRELGRKVLIEEMQKQVREDGSHFEQSIFYHRYSVEFFLCAGILADRNGTAFPWEYRSRLEKMVEFLCYTAWPSGSHVSIGDSDGGRAIPFGKFDAEDHRPAISTAAVYFRRGDFRRAAGGLREQTLWLLGAAAGAEFASLDAASPSAASRTFAGAGIVTMRSDWSGAAKFLTFDVGPQGMRSSGHGHADALSVNCAANGVEWLVDPGTYVYSASRVWRDFFRSTPAHNTIAVDGMDQAERVDWFKWRNLPAVTLEQSYSFASLDYAAASHNGYQRLDAPVIHRRHVVFVKPDYWLISDELAGRGRHQINVFFHFAPGVSVEPAQQGWLATKGSEKFLLVPLASGLNFCLVYGSESPIQGWYSSDYGRRKPAYALVGEIETTVPAEFGWLLWPVKDETPRFRQMDPQGHAFSIETKDQSDRIALGRKATKGSKDAFSTDGALAFARWGNSDAMKRLTLLGGSFVWSGGRAILTAGKTFHHFDAVIGGDETEIEASPAQAFRFHTPRAQSVRLNGKPAAFIEDADALVFQGEH